MISGDWQPRAINSGTQSFTTTNASSSPVTASGVAANPPTSGSDSTSTSSASASNSSPMMSFIDLMTAGVTQGQVGASIGEGASTSLPSAIDLQREILSSFQVALGKLNFLKPPSSLTFKAQLKKTFRSNCTHFICVF